MDWREDLPKRLRIGGLHYDLEVVPGRMANSNGIWGKMHPYSQKIEIDDQVTGQRAVNTLLHECLHGIWQWWAIGGESGQCKEVEAVTAFANGLSLLFSDNPKLLTWVEKHKDSVWAADHG